jgi:hypothetical protein
MARTPKLNLNKIYPQQEDNEGKITDSFRILDSLVQPSVLDMNLNSPPANPNEGDCYVVGTSPTGAWAGHKNHITEYYEGEWRFIVPRNGWMVWAIDEGKAYYFDVDRWKKAIGWSAEIGTTDLENFAVDASKLWTNVIMLEGDTWTFTSGKLTWNQHNLYLNGTKYVIAAGVLPDTNKRYVYWRKGAPTIYLSSTSHPADNGTINSDPSSANYGFLIAIQYGANSYELAWNSFANAVIGTAYISDAAVTNAKIASISADKITVGDIDTARMQGNAANAVNAGYVKIIPGQVLISGNTSLSDWRHGTDYTKIAGAAIYTGSITADKITIGNRNIAISGLGFYTHPSYPNKLFWEAGTISYLDDNLTPVTKNISANAPPNGVQWTNGTIWIYWVKDATTLSSGTVSQAFGDANHPNNLVLGSYSGGKSYVENYGRTIIDGSHITTGTIQSSDGNVYFNLDNATISVNKLGGLHILGSGGIAIDDGGDIAVETTTSDTGELYWWREDAYTGTKKLLRMYASYEKQEPIPGSPAYLNYVYVKGVAGTNSTETLEVSAFNYIGITAINKISFTVPSFDLTGTFRLTGNASLGGKYYTFPTTGTVGNFLKIASGTGTSSDPFILNWATVSGGGDVYKSGSPAANQVAFWTDGTHIGGYSGFTYDSSNGVLTVAGSINTPVFARGSGQHFDWNIGSVNRMYLFADSWGIQLTSGGLASFTSGNTTFTVYDTAGGGVYFQAGYSNAYHRFQILDAGGSNRNVAIFGLNTISLGWTSTNRVNFIAGATSPSVPPNGATGSPGIWRYGINSDSWLGTPNGWLDVQINGTAAKIPYYI